MSVPNFSEYVIVGAGIHGLSTAWRLAKKLNESGEDVGGNNVSASHTPGEGWQILFNSEYMEGEGEDAFKIESSTMIMCDDSGENCSDMTAG